MTALPPSGHMLGYTVLSCIIIFDYHIIDISFTLVKEAGKLGYFSCVHIFSLTVHDPWPTLSALFRDCPAAVRSTNLCVSTKDFGYGSIVCPRSEGMRQYAKYAKYAVEIRVVNRCL